jgi:nucleoside-diphosphate-sugar epimerase
MRIFLTGATGVIGHRVVPILLGTGHRVTAVGRSPEKRAALQGMGADAVELDIFRPDAVRRAVAGHDAIINLATHLPASTARMFLPGAWRENDRIRQVASAVLADAAAAAGAGWFIQESFAPVYADGGDNWIDETWPLKPARYNRTVVDAEQSAERFTRRGGTGVVLRFAMFYGPDAFQVHDLIGLVRKGWAPVFGPHGFISSISHDDAATAVVAALGVGPGAYNVADDEPLRRREWVDSLAAALRSRRPKLPPKWFSRLGGSLTELLARSQRISNRKLRQESGWAPRYPSVREGWFAVVESLKSGGWDRGST